MSHYIKRPEKERTIGRDTVVERFIDRPLEQKTEQIDVNALANAIAQAINVKVPQGQTIVKTDDVDTFDDSSTMKRLATEMLVIRGDSKANFDNLGNISTTKKDLKDVDDTIDLLQNLDN